MTSKYLGFYGLQNENSINIFLYKQIYQKLKNRIRSRVARKKMQSSNSKFVYILIGFNLNKSVNVPKNYDMIKEEIRSSVSL